MSRTRTRARAESQRTTYRERCAARAAAVRRDLLLRRHRSSLTPKPAYVTPLVRKLAKEHDVDLGTLNGTGVGGRIRKQDVLAAGRGGEAGRSRTGVRGPGGSRPQPLRRLQRRRHLRSARLRGTTEKMSRLRQTIAKRMVESLQVSAQLTATVEVDMTAISQIRAKVKDDFKQREGATLSYLPFIAKASVEALKAYPK